jgi:hypothetical protein
LNHVSGGRASVAGVYRHDWATEKRAALDALAAHVMAVGCPQRGDVGPRRLKHRLVVSDAAIGSTCAIEASRGDNIKNCSAQRIVVAYEAGRDGFWLARWLLGQGIESYVVSSS